MYIERVLKVIESSKTLEQLEVAENYSNLYYDKLLFELINRDHSSMDLSLCEMQLDELKSFVRQKRTELESNRLEYKGYVCYINYSEDDECFWSKIDGISDLVCFDSDTFEGMKDIFIENVEDYILIKENYDRM